MRADDVTDTLELALVASSCDSAKVVHKPRLLSDNGSSYISSDLAEWLKDRGIAHVRGAPCHPQTQAKIERWHQTLKNRILLENYYLPGDLEAQIARFVEHYNYTPIVLLARPAAQVWGPGEKQRTNKMPFSQESHTTAPSVGLLRTTGPSQTNSVGVRSAGSPRGSLTAAPSR